MEYLVYIIINLLLFWVFVVVGKSIEYHPKKNFWRLYTPVIVAYTLILGIRYNRGADYKHYQDVFNWNLDADKKLFTFLNDLLKVIGIDDIGIFFVYSFIFICLSGFLIKEYRNFAKWLLPMFLAANIYFNEWFISQGLGLSFVLLFCAFLFNTEINVKKKVYLCVLSALCAFSIHSGNLFNLFIVTVLYFVYDKPFDWRICIILYLFSSYYFQYHTDFTLINQMLVYINGLDSRMDEYIKRGDDWFSNYAIHDDYYRNGFLKTLQTLGECSFFYFANMAFKSENVFLCLEKRRCLIVLFNMFVIGSILGQMFFAVEILKRIATSFYLVWCFPLAYVVRVVNFNKLSVSLKILYCFMFWFGYEYLKYIFYRVDGVYTFLWDKVG